jgi:hypothetical protein
MKLLLSPTEAAFSGFSLIRREWRAVLIWAALRLVVSLVMLGVVALIAGDDIARLAEVGAGTPEQLSDPLAVFQTFKGFEPVLLITWPVGLLFQAVMLSALYRAYLRPEESRYAFLRLGRTELVMVAVMLLIGALYLCALFLVTFAAGLVAAVAAKLAPELAALVGLVLLVAVIAAHIWAPVRVSLSLADSFDRNRISLFHSLTLTRGHFWSLFGAYVLALALTVVIMLVALAAFMIVAAIAALIAGQGLSTVGQALNPDPLSVAGAFSVAAAIWLVFSSITGACSYPLILGPTAEAYKAFKAQGGPPPAQDFHEEGEIPAGPWQTA